MRSLLAEEILSSSTLNALAAMHLVKKPVCTNFIARHCGFSPRGSVLVIQRLRDLGFVEEVKRKKRTLFQACLNQDCEQLLQHLLTHREKLQLKRSQERYQHRASDTFSLQFKLHTFHQNHKSANGSL